MLIRETRAEDRPRERFAENPRQASLTDLVAILLRTGRKGHSVMEVAREVVGRLESATGISGFDDLDWRDLTDIKGIGPDKAVTICAAVELGRRLTIISEKRRLIPFDTAERIANFFMERLRHESQEHFIVCYLNAKMRLLGWKEINLGSLSSSPIDLKEALRWAIRYKAHSLVLIHNHPSGYPEPSKADIDFTEKFVKAAKLVDFEVAEHIIIGDGIFVSFHERGLL